MKTLYKLLLPLTMAAALSCNDKKISDLENALAKHDIPAYKTMMDHVFQSQIGHYEDSHSNTIFMSRCFPTFKKNCETCKKYGVILEKYMDARIGQAQKAKLEFAKDSEKYKKLETIEKYLTETKKEYFPNNK